MNLLRHPGLDLPVYSEDEVAWTTREIGDAANSGAESFIRRACLRYEGTETDLQTVLALGDRVLSKVCGVMGIDQVGHGWGLAPLSDSNRDRLRACVYPRVYESNLTSYNESRLSLIPAGYGLVASVDVIAGAEPLNYNQRARAVDGGNPSRISVEENGFRVTNEDLQRAVQFVSDPTRLELPTGGIVLVDVEPRLRLTPIAAS